MIWNNYEKKILLLKKMYFKYKLKVKSKSKRKNYYL